MTPFAVLLVKPSDSDEVVRKSYHSVARLEHPDVKDNPAKARDLWYAATEAYTAIKTEALRAEWLRRQAALAGVCEACDGCGVVGTRMFKGKIRICEKCEGEGRV